MPTREGNYCQKVFSSWKRWNTPRFRTLLSGKEAVKTFFYKCPNSGKMNPLHSQFREQSCTGSNAAPEIPLQKNLSRKIARFLVSKISPATGERSRSVCFDAGKIGICHCTQNIFYRSRLLSALLERWPQVSTRSKLCSVRFVVDRGLPRQIIRFHNKTFDKIRCKLDSTENPLSRIPNPSPIKPIRGPFKNPTQATLDSIIVIYLIDITL